jgi:hypothetical protein
MSNNPKENAAPTVMGNGAKSSIEAGKLLRKHTPKRGVGAIYFWNHASQSVEPLRVRHGGVMV